MTDGTSNLQPIPPSDGKVDVVSQQTKAFQPDDLHDLFEVTDPALNEDDPLAAVRNDPNYAALIRDLEYIAAQARLLFNASEATPSDSVWDRIQSKLGETADETDDSTENNFKDNLDGVPAFIPG